MTRTKLSVPPGCRCSPPCQILVAQVVEDDLGSRAGVVGDVAEQSLLIVGAAPDALVHLHDAHRPDGRGPDDLPPAADELPPAALLPRRGEHEVAIGMEWLRKASPKLVLLPKMSNGLPGRYPGGDFTPWLSDRQGQIRRFLLARAGVDVLVLGKHAEFLRDLRGTAIPFGCRSFLTTIDQ